MARIDNRGNLRGSAAPVQGSQLTGGAADLLALSKRLKQTGETELRKEFHKAVREAAKPLARKVKAEAPKRIPRHRGGIGEHYGKKKVEPSVRTGATTAGVSLRMPKTDPRVDAQGRIFHPVFGRRVGVGGKPIGQVQIVPGVKGFFSEAAKEAAPEVVDGILAVIRDYTIRALKMGL